MTTETLNSTREEIAARKERDYKEWLAYRKEQQGTEVHASPERDLLEEAKYKLACETLGVDPLDIMKRAEALIEAHDFAPRQEWEDEYEDNARTALFEALTSSGHLSRVELCGTPEEVNRLTLERLLNGMQPDLPDHELKRRFQEICEELIVQETLRQILAGELPEDTEIATESTYVVGLSNDQAEKIGYRWRNKKGMTRSTGFVFHPDKKITRVVEQISYSNSSAHESILRRHQEGIPTQRSDEPDVDLLGSSLLYRRADMADGVIDIQRRIDAFAGEGIMYGESIDDTTLSYEDLRSMSQTREALVGGFIDQLANWERELDAQLKEGAITQAERNKLYMKEVRTIVRAICILQPEYTEAALGKDVVDAYRAANEKFVSGDSDGAASTVEAVSHLETEIVICGNADEQQQSPEQGPRDDALRNKLREESLKCVTCPFCRKPVDAIRTKNKGIRCPRSECDMEVVRGEIIDHKLEKVTAEEKERAQAEQTRRASARKGRRPPIYFEIEIGIGTERVTALDDNGMVIAEGFEAFALRRQLFEEARGLAA